MSACHDLNRFPQHQMTNHTFQLLGNFCGKVDVVTTVDFVRCHVVVVVDVVVVFVVLVVVLSCDI